MKIEDFLPANFREYERNILTYNHSMLVASAAEKIAKTYGLDPDTAFLCGEMHDVGKFIGVSGVNPQKFYQHPRIGYELLKNINMQVAKVCIAHSFPLKSKTHVQHFCNGDNVEADAIWQILRNVEYDDYIELIQLCDKISSHDKYVSIAEKIEWYKSKGKISMYDLEKYYRIPLLKLKAKFDNAIAMNKVYECTASDNKV